MPSRSKVERRYTWNAESLFTTPRAWETELESVLETAGGMEGFRGRLSAGPAALADVMAAVEELSARVMRVYVYAGFAYSVDTANQDAAAMNDKALSALGRVAAAVSFLNPELIAMGEPALLEWIRQEPRLSHYGHFLHDLFRRQAHVRSVEVEELLGMLADPFSGPTNTATMLTSADFTFAAGRTTKGSRVEVTQGTLDSLLESPDRKTRRSAWESYTDRYIEFKNTLAANLAGSLKMNMFRSRARKYGSTLEAVLFTGNLPAEVFHNAVTVFRENLPIWHRYFRLRRKVLGVKELRHYDMWAPLAKKKARVGFERAVDLICRGLEPMGAGYVDVLRKGCLEDRWVDVQPNKGKRSGAFSWGSYGTLPFIMMSYTGDVSSLSTLAHELGHSMHSYFAWKTQPFIYSEYSIFVAEVASNFHQAMVRASLLGKDGEADLQIPVIEEAMANFFRYFFIMPTLARFEWETHQRVEKGQALTADSMIGVMADLLEEGYGAEAAIDRPREGMIWATFPHLFEDYYVFQYATGISGAQALSGRILRGAPDAVRDYLSFLKAGSSVYPLEALKGAGVDLSGRGPMEETFAVMNGYIERLEKLLG